MKESEQALQRVLAAAAEAQPGVALPPPGLEGRVLARWRAGGVGEEFILLAAFLRRATVGASVVLLLSAAWSLTRSEASHAGDEAARLDYEIQMSLNP